MNRFLAALLVGLLVSSPAFAALRCGSKIVTKGDPSSEVAAKCGEPADVIRMNSILRRPVVWLHGRPRYLGEDYIEVQVEAWLYNFGPNKLMRRVRFENGLVAEIETLGYGYN